MKKSIPFARFGLIVPLINFLNDIGSNINSHLQKAHIPVDILEDTEKISKIQKKLSPYQC